MRAFWLAVLLALAACTNALNTRDHKPPAREEEEANCILPGVIQEQAFAYAKEQGWVMRLIVLERDDASKFLRTFNAIEPVSTYTADTIHIYRAGRTRDLLIFIVNGCVTGREWPPVMLTDRLLAHIRGVPT